MNQAQAMLLVAEREVREAMRRRLFWIILGVLFLGSTAAMVIPEFVGSDGPTKFDVAVVGETARADGFGEVLVGLGPDFDAVISIVPLADAEAARAGVDDEKVDVAVVLDDKPTIIVRAGENDRLVGAVAQALSSLSLVDRLHDAGLTDDEVTDVLTAPQVRVEELNKESESRLAASIGLSLVLYLLLLTVMVQVANGIAIEKANRISEVLLAIVRPGPLMFGKVLGVGLVGVSALSAAIVPVVVKLAIGGKLPAGIGGALAGSVIWFVLGLTLYLLIAAALGAMVERQEEAGSAVSPLTAILVATFIVAQGEADTVVGNVLAYVPLTSPIVVPIRLAMGESSAIELVTSVVILVLSILLAARVGSRVYARAIVQTGHRLKLREVLGRRSGGPG
ncbi:MAG TPA: ABC transporter permease [Ilumatobacteraceae bacterium]|nr:ABC transporter permease [Ilumatobacteraceae bacterium]